MNNKGLTNSLLTIFVLLFSFAFVSVLVLAVHGEWSDLINGLPSDVASEHVKDQIIDNTKGIFLLDTFFVIFIVVLIIAYLITSFTLPTQNAWFFLLFAGFLIIVTIAAMIFSNSWSYIISDPFFSSAVGDVPITDYVLRHFPLFVFFTGVIGGVIFYSRSREDSFSGNSGGDFDSIPPTSGDFGGGDEL